MQELKPEDIYRDYNKYRVKDAIKQMYVKGNMAWDLKDDYKFFMRWFYWLKALICLYLNRLKIDGFEIIVITYYESNYPDGASWEYVSVGEGIFKNWTATVGTDGT